MEDVNKAHDMLCARLLEACSPKPNEILGLYEEAHDFMMDDEAAFERWSEGAMLDSGVVMFGNLAFRPYINFKENDINAPCFLDFEVDVDDCEETEKVPMCAGVRTFDAYGATFKCIDILRMDFADFYTEFVFQAVEFAAGIIGKGILTEKYVVGKH